MPIPGATRPFRAWTLAGVAVLVTASCKNPTPTPAPAPVPGATLVRGTERLAWNQTGDLTGLSFRAYVDGGPVPLASATCDATTPDANCSSPLPALTDGVHTITLTAVLTSAGLESTPADPLTVQKVPGTSATRAASLSDAVVSPGALRLDRVIADSGDLTFTADVVARGVQAPAQLAWVPDGRLLIAEADGRVRIVRPGQPDRQPRMLDTIGRDNVRALVSPTPASPPGLARHPDFSQNHFVYVSFIARDGQDRLRLHIVRLREVNDTLGEPATVYEGALVADAAIDADAANSSSGSATTPIGGPRLAFGPDGLLYVALPFGLQFDGEPAASRPHPSMLRLSDDGRVPSGGPLSNISAHPIGFTWEPGTGALLVAVAGGSGDALIQRATAGRRTAGLSAASRVRLRMTDAPGSTSRALLVQGTEMATPDLPEIIRLNLSIVGDGLLTNVGDRFGDLVTGEAGTLFLATNNAARAGGDGVDGEDVIVRIRPRKSR